jgi:pimeloyl-ACP methyl ester carboxylesterase
MNRLVILLGAVLSCSVAPRPDLPAPAGALATILVPGYKGSFLVDAHGERAWLNPEETFTPGDRTLALPFEGERPFNGFGPLHPDGPMTRLGVLFIHKDIYSGFLEFARSALPGLVAFGYDWRKDIRESARDLCETIARLPVERVDLVAHSMGGLVAMHCLHSGAPKVRRVVFAGTPFRGGAQIMNDFLDGTKTGRNGALLSKEALFSFPAAFQLLPPEGEFNDPEAWVRNGWGVFADAAIKADPAYRAQLERMLLAHRESDAALAGSRGTRDTLTIIGTGRPTIQLVHPADREHPERADGDGSVLVTSATLEGAQVLQTQAEHGDLLLDEGVQREIARFLRQ